MRPTQIKLSRVHGWRSHRTSGDLVEVPGAPGFTPSSDETDEPWRAGLDTLAATLKAEGGGLGGVAVVLSDHFTRYALLSWNESLITDSERMAFARHAFREVYGATADAWEVCLDEQPAGQRFFAAAIDRALLGGLRDIVSGLGGKLVALTPALSDCINRHRRALAEREFCLATVESGRVSFAFRGRGGWSAVRSRRMEGPLAEALPTLLKQEAVAASVADGGVLYLCAAGLADQPPFSVPGWRLIRLVEDKPARAQSGRARPTMLSRLSRSG
jgi:hypothetical protein